MGGRFKLRARADADTALAVPLAPMFDGPLSPEQIAANRLSRAHTVYERRTVGPNGQSQMSRVLILPAVGYTEKQRVKWEMAKHGDAATMSTVSLWTGTEWSEIDSTSVDQLDHEFDADVVFHRHMVLAAQIIS